MLGLFKGYLLEEYDAGEKDGKGNPKKSSRLWSDKAIEKVDDYTVRLNCVLAADRGRRAPLPLPDVDHATPKENGVFELGSNGTGAVHAHRVQVGKKAKY